ncbi:hypothetical protein HQQ94_13215 [Shewanella sp. VB17]|uniref:hypothetical protein n=1 Tax=Shewanella sp. VB17 TaxID=2739432 RepID=UPI001566AAAD|nr:hypothetical protein [Shewanella sp. VB17]NRD74179.1 hypothetical protein [Shewanella sp. VB17]
MAADSDGDGLDDSIERMYGWNPYDVNSPGESDYDGDGLTDLTEYKAFTNIYDENNPVAAGDTDNDGDTLQKGLEVFLMGTDPEKIDTDCDEVDDNLDANPVDGSCHQGQVTIGGTGPYNIYLEWNSNPALNNRNNYGESGVYPIEGINIVDVTSDLGTLSGVELVNKYDILQVSNTDTYPQKLLEYVNAGGVLIFGYNVSGNATISAFGGTGTLGHYNAPAMLTLVDDLVNNGPFGSIVGAIDVINTYPSGMYSTASLPAGSTLFATMNGTAAGFVAGDGGRAVFMNDEYFYRRFDNGNDTVDTNQEKFIHNILSYALDKAN